MTQKSLPMTRDGALELLKSMPQEDSDMNHYLETEAIMRALAKRFGEDEEYWGMLGLLHDVDWSLTKEDTANHTVKAEGILKEKGFDDEFIQVLQSHAYGMEEIPAHKDKQRTKKIEHVDPELVKQLVRMCGWERMGDQWFCPDCAARLPAKTPPGRGRGRSAPRRERPGAVR